MHAKTAASGVSVVLASHTVCGTHAYRGLHNTVRHDHIYSLITMLTQFIHVVQVGGFLQRIDYVRKYAFGVMCILKNSEGQFPIRGFWIFRGQDIPQMMKDECYDLELYDWQKLDSKNLNPVGLLQLLRC